MSRAYSPLDKAHPSIFELSDLDSRDGQSLPAPAFLRFLANAEEVEEYHEALSVGPAPPPGFWTPKRVPRRGKKTGPSSSSDASLKRLRKTCMVPDSVQFLLPAPGQSAENPPRGYFTCFEAHVISSRLWFPIPRVIVEFLDRLGLSIGQVTPVSFQHIVGILVLGFERGMLITADYLEAFLSRSGTTADCFYLSPQPYGAIIRNTSSNCRDWRDWFFYVRIDEASVEADGIPFVRTERVNQVPDIKAPPPDDSDMVRSLLRGGPVHWGHFSPQRIRRAVDYYSSGFPREDHVEVEVDDDPGAQENDVPIGHGSIEDLVDFDILTEDLDEFLGEAPVETPAETPFAKASRLVNKGFCVMNDAIRASDAEIRDAESRAEAAEREVTRLREEYNANVSRARQMAAGTIARVREEHEADSCRVTESTKTKVRRARREGKRHVCAEMSVRRERFGTHFAEAAEAYRMNGAFREQRGVAGGVDLTQDKDYSYDAMFAKHSSRMSRLEKKRADFPALEADVWETWDPIVVSPDTVEVGYDVPDTSGEVDQPRTDQNSLSGFYNFD